MRKLLLFTLCFYSFLNSVNAQTDDDPDLPKFLNVSVNKEEYFKAKENFFLSRQAMLHPLNYNPRSAAIAVMKQMEVNQRNNPFSRILSPSWIQLGPSPIPNGQTTTISVAISGRVTAVAIHPTNANIVYIGTANGGVYRSMNGGTNWTPIFDAAESLAIGALTLAPSNPSTLYVGTGEPQNSQDSHAGVGLYRIDNADASPTLVGPINPLVTTGIAGTTAFTGRSISKILVDPANAANIYVSTNTGSIGNPGGLAGSTIPPLGIRGLYRSTNATSAAGSVSFTKIKVTSAVIANFGADLSGNRSIIDMVMEPGNADVITCWVNGTNVAGDGGIYRTTNASAATPTFTHVYITKVSNARGELSIAKVGSVATLFCGSGDSTSVSNSGKIMKSIDAGATWTQVAGSFTFCGGQCFYDIAVEIDPADTSKVYVGGSSGTRIFQRTIDGGTTFTVSNTRLHADVHVIKSAPSSPSTLYLGCDGGIFKSTDGGVTWTSSNTAGLHAAQYQSIALHPVNPNFTIGGTQDNGTHMLMPDGTFKRVDGGDGGYALIDQNATNTTNVTMYHTYFNQVNSLIGYSRNVNGTAAADDWTFFGCNGGIPLNDIPCTGPVLFYAPMTLGPGNPNTVYYGSNIVYRSADKGLNHTAVSQDLVTSISSISVSPQNDNIRIVGLNNGQVWATITGSATLVNITPLGAPALPVGRVMISPTNSNIAFIGYVGYFGNTNSHFYKTINLNALGGSGVVWSSANTGLPDVPINCMTMSAANVNDIFVGTDIGVFGSVDAGTTWTNYSMNLPIVPVFDMAIHKVTNILRIATHGRGLWETASSPLPVSFTSFEVSVFNKTNVLLQWFTATETNNKGFEVQRVSIGSNASVLQWEKIGFVNGSGTTTSPRRYEFTDVPVGGKKFLYRLKQVDFDNNIKFSEQRQISLNDFDFALFPVYPNPVKGSAIIKYQLPDDGAANLSVYNSSGALLRTVFNESKEAGIYQTAINTNGLPGGAYYISLKAGIYYNTKSFIVQ